MGNTVLVDLPALFAQAGGIGMFTKIIIDLIRRSFPYLPGGFFAIAGLGLAIVLTFVFFGATGAAMTTQAIYQLILIGIAAWVLAFMSSENQQSADKERAEAKGKE